MRDYCLRCHRGPESPGKISLADPRAPATMRRIWTRVRNGQMPPEGARQPSEAQRELLTRWIEEALGTYHGRPDPGRVVLRRLNRTEYRNTIRDLIGIEFDGDLPSDDIGFGFDNVGDVLTIPPALFERYFDCARKIVDRAVLPPEDREPKKRVFGVDEMTSGGGGQRVRDLYVQYAPGEGAWDAALSAAGDYEIRVRAAADQAGPEPAKMELRVDDKPVALLEVRAVRGRPQVYAARAQLSRGSRRISVVFVNDYYRPSDPDPSQRDRNLILHDLELEGPIGLAIPESHRRIFVSGDARDVLARFLRRAFRRPPAAEEVGRYVALFEEARRRGDSFEQAMKGPLTAALVSPHFLFRVEPDLPGPPVRAVGEGELAVRLSYFLWSTMPDEELFALAERGGLRAGLEEQVRRMIRDPRASAFAENFGSQWLQTRRLAAAAPDPVAFPEFDDDLRRAMMREPELVLESIVREDRSCLELLDSNYTFVDERLARHYGIAGVTGPEMRRVLLPDRRRGGVVTMAAVLAATSTPTRTSPPKRGKWVLEVLLGAPPPPPLPDAPSLRETGDARSLRERLELHRADARCASCHRTMDPIGFGLENFDALGSWREADASATLPGGRAFSGPAELKTILLSRRDDFVRCLVEKVLTYAVGRGLDAGDAPTVRRIAAAVAADGYRFGTLLVEVARSHPFQHRRNRGDGAHD